MEQQWHLAERDFFADLEREREAFLRAAFRREVKKNEMIFFEEDPGESCFYLDTGIVKIFKITASGKEPIFFLRREGEMFGLAEVMHAHGRKANAQALTPCVLYEVKRADFEAHLAANPATARRVIDVLGGRVRYLGQQIENMMVCDVGTRLAKLLVYLSLDDLSDAASWERPVTISVSLTQEQLAAMTGSCQQTVSEFLRRFQADGLVDVSRKAVTVLHPLRLLERAEM